MKQSTRARRVPSSLAWTVFSRSRVTLTLAALLTGTAFCSDPALVGGGSATGGGGGIAGKFRP